MNQTNDKGITHLLKFLHDYENDPKKINMRYLDEISSHLLIPKGFCDKWHISCTRPYLAFTTYIGKWLGNWKAARKDDYINLYLRLIDYYDLRNIKTASFDIDD